MIFFLFVSMYATGVLGLKSMAFFGASAFIAFALPQKNSSRPKYLIGGYLTGIISGIVLYFLLGLLHSLEPWQMYMAQAVSAGLCFFLMVILEYEHPPAAALAMFLPAESNIFLSCACALVGILLMTAIKELLKKWLIDLV